MVTHEDRYVGNVIPCNGQKMSTSVVSNFTDSSKGFQCVGHIPKVGCRLIEGFLHQKGSVEVYSQMTFLLSF